MTARWLGLLAVLVGLATSADAGAHLRSTSYSWWQIDGDRISVRWSVAARDLTALRSLGASHRLRVEGACREGPVVLRPDEAARRTFTWEVRCEGPPRELVIDALFDAIPSHLHFAEIRRGDVRREHVLSAEHRTVSLIAPEPAPWWSLVVTGARHVLEGLDHLVYLLALALMIRSRRQLLWLVTGFTLGHAVSMSLVVLGLVETHEPTVEALIGASILLLGAEVLRQERGQPRAVIGAVGLVLVAAAAGAWRASVNPLALVGLAIMVGCYLGGQGATDEGSSSPGAALLTTVFGVMHGMGFASVVGVFDTKQVVSRLLAFNLGVELAQLATVLVALLVLRVSHHRGRRDVAVELGAAAASALGTFWLVTRVLVGA